MPTFIPLPVKKPPPPTPLELFASIDVDSSGTIDREEFTKALKDRLKMGPKQLDALFEEVDANKDGNVSLLEFSKVLKSHPQIFESGNLFSKVPGFDKNAEAKASSLSPIDYFHVVDTDGNGQLSLAELTVALKVNHVSREAVREIFANCDKDKSGSISLIEWMRMTKEHEELLPTKLEKPPPFLSTVSPMDLFTEMDKDGSGSVSRSEFQEALSERFMSAGAIEKLFSEADADNSGEVSLLEWSKAVKKFPELTSTGNASAFAEYLTPMEYFAWMDKESTGKVTKADLAASLKKSNVSGKAIDLIFEKVDADGSGDISMIEWANAVKACPALLPEKLGMPAANANLGDQIVAGLTLGIVKKK